MLVKEDEVAFEQVVESLSERCKIQAFGGSARWEKGIRRDLRHFEAQVVDMFYDILIPYVS